MLLHAETLTSIPGIHHGFTTREGGVSEGTRRSLNLALSEGESPQRLEENWRRALAPALPADLAICDQVHGDAVLVIKRGQGCLSTVGAADALVSATPGVVVAVRTADCVPILLAAPGAVAAVHAGWRGTVAPILGPAVKALCQLAGCRPDQVQAAIGPCISQSAYPVGKEVVDALARLDLGVCVERTPSGQTRVDLARANRLLLHRYGVQRVEVLGVCTVNDPRMYSYRAEGPGTGRQAAYIGLLS